MTNLLNASSLIVPGRIDGISSVKSSLSRSLQFYALRDFGFRNPFDRVHGRNPLAGFATQPGLPGRPANSYLIDIIDGVIRRPWVFCGALVC
jgi:hypothetical protein